jgi:uncharacterized membrane protein
MAYEPGPRRQLVLELHRRGTKASDIARTLNISATRVHQHLRELERRGLITREKA